MALLDLESLERTGVRRGLEIRHAPAQWRLETFVGRLAEVSAGRAGAALTLVFRLVLEAQRAGEPVAWVGCGSGTFFPPDVAAAGIDIAALPVVRTESALAVASAADRLLRSGGFGLIVLDLGIDSRFPMAAQTRLAGLAKKHDAALVCITEKDDRRPSLGSLVSLRAEAQRAERTAEGFRCEVQVLKDKRRSPDWSHEEVCRAPDGLC